MKVEFGNLNKKLLLLLIFPIFFQISNLILPREVSALYYYFTSVLGYLLAGIFYLIILYKSRNYKKEASSRTTIGRYSILNPLYLENQSVIKQRKIKKLYSIFLLSLINMVPIILENNVLTLELYKKFTNSLGVLIIILFYMFFSKIILNLKIYKHQIISLFFISVCSIISILIDIYFEIDLKPEIFSDCVLTLLCFIVLNGFYSLYSVLIKKHFETHLNSPYNLMFFVGLFSFILIIPLNLFVYFYNEAGKILGKDVINQIIDLYEKYNIKFIFLFIFDIISKFICLVGIIHTIYYFTPCHYIISFIFSQFLFKISEWIRGNSKNEEKDEWYFVLIYVLLYGIIIFSSLIYNEIIIIHLWSMEENTFKYISFRQRLESEDSLLDDENLEGRNTVLSYESIGED